ncbi:MAG: MarR family transcriptional regulator [Aestuariivirga sp.]
MKSTQNSLGFMVADVSRLLRRSFELKLADSDITFSQARALVYVSRYEGVRQIDLAELLEVQPIRLARLLDSLEDMHLVERRASAEDRRAWHIYARPAAAKVLAQFEVKAAALRDEATKGLSQAEVNVLMKLLGLVRNNLHAMQDTLAKERLGPAAKTRLRKDK